MESMCTCVKCSSVVPTERVVEINGSIICKNCLSKFASKKSGASKPHINGFLLLMASCIPGANYMYMGLMKRGLLLMSSFFGLFYLMNEMPRYHSGFVQFVFPVIFIYSFFDGFAKRRLINAGIPVEDGAPDVVDFISKYKIPLAVAVAALILLPVVIMPLGKIIGFAMAVCGILMIINHCKKSPSQEKESVIDMRNNQDNE